MGVSETIYIPPMLYRILCHDLYTRVRDSGFKPTKVTGVFRLGASIAHTLGEFSACDGDPWMVTDPLNVHAYSLGEHVPKEPRIIGTPPTIDSDDKLLLVDEVFDTGGSLGLAADFYRSIAQEVKIGVLHSKPGKNTTGREPDYCLHPDVHNDTWVWYWHELDGKKDHTPEEIRQYKGRAMYELIQGRDPGHVECPSYSEQILVDGCRTALQVVESGFNPQVVLAMSPGGIDAALVMSEFLSYNDIGTRPLPLTLDCNGMPQLLDVEPLLGAGVNVLVMNEIADAATHMAAGKLSGICRNGHVKIAAPYTCGQYEPDFFVESRQPVAESFHRDVQAIQSFPEQFRRAHPHPDYTHVSATLR